MYLFYVVLYQLLTAVINLLIQANPTGVQMGGDTVPFATGTSCPSCPQHWVTVGSQAVKPMGSALSVAQPFSP